MMRPATPPAMPPAMAAILGPSPPSLLGAGVSAARAVSAGTEVVEDVVSLVVGSDDVLDEVMVSVGISDDELDRRVDVMVSLSDDEVLVAVVRTLTEVVSSSSSLSVVRVAAEALLVAVVVSSGLKRLETPSAIDASPSRSCRLSMAVETCRSSTQSISKGDARTAHKQRREDRMKWPCFILGG